MSRYKPNKQFREAPPSLPPLYQPAVAAGNSNVTDHELHTGYDPWAESRGCAEPVESDSGG